jgi:hypothetical protein
LSLSFLLSSFFSFSHSSSLSSSVSSFFLQPRATKYGTPDNLKLQNKPQRICLPQCPLCA